MFHPVSLPSFVLRHQRHTSRWLLICVVHQWWRATVDIYWCLEVYWWQTVSGPAMQVAAVFDELLLPLATLGFSYPGHQRLLCPQSLMLIVHHCSWSYSKIIGGAFAKDLDSLLSCSKLLTLLTCCPQCAWKSLFYRFLLALYSHYIISAKECS